MDRKAKQIDLCLAVHIAAHTAVTSIDYLGELLSVLGKNSALENIRTKCSKLIKNVISPAMLTELINDVDNQKFFLIIDESPDVSVIKYLAFCVQNFSLKRKSIITDFLGFVEVERATGIILCNSTIQYLTAIGLDYKNVIGIASDSAANMISVENDFFKFFKDKMPIVQLIKCSCHSLHLCLSKAAEQLPADLEFLVRESRNWFANIPLRRIQYESLYSAINKGDMPLKLVQLVKTRWLAWSKAINVLVEQWLELKTYFNIHLVEHLPTNINHFETLQYLTPDECLNPCPNRVDFFKLLLFLTILNDDVDVLKT
ncbi:PREDICTED: uncharacterized protein LOC108778209 [Cyphomyrmex costatus]|uniref:uncharacterized protein LOC108778209 n=1 Tax=Cyphomyrmex costatus TaxID=456900 RepID=UPI0008522901|nr:PREDICTED: uncharacterized protein LOC108778209 [Cyphomyrmex costatus]